MKRLPRSSRAASKRATLPTSKRPLASAVRCALEPLEGRRLLSYTGVLQYHNDLARTGQNLNETVLTPADVNVSSFGKLFSKTVDGQVYAQPLYVSQVNITSGASQGTHNVVYVATEGDSLYAFDADNGTQLWHDSFLIANPALQTPGATVAVTTVPSADTKTGDINPQIGITSTPVIDSNTGSLFLTAKTKQVVTVSGVAGTPHYVYTLYKVNIQDGTFTSAIMGDTVSNGSTYSYRQTLDPYVVGTGDGSITVSGQHRVYFNTLRQMNRSSLTLSNGNVYMSFASHGDNGPYHGWVLGYKETDLSPTAVFNTTPNGGLGGIWQGGDSLAIDPQGFFYVETGNGSFANTSSTGVVTGLDANGFPINGDYGDSFIKIALDPTSNATSQNVNGWGMKVVDFFTPLNQFNLNNADEDLGSGGPMVLPDSLGTAANPHLLVGAGKQGLVYLIDRDHMGHFDPNTDNVVNELQALGGGGSFDTPALFNDGTTSRIYYVAVSSNLTSIQVSNGMLISDATSSDTFSSRSGTASISANGTANGIVWAINPANNGGTPALRAYNASDITQELWTSQLNSNRDGLGSATKFSTPTIINGQVFVGTANAIVSYGPLTRPKQPPAAPTNLTATVVSGVQINLSWQETDTTTAGFNVEESTDGGKTFNALTTLGANAASYSVTGLTPNTPYSFRVRAFNSAGNSGYSNIASATTSNQTPSLDFSGGFTNAASLLTLNGSATISGSNLQLTDGNGNEAASAFSDTVLPVQRFNTAFTFQLSAGQTADGFTLTFQNDPRGASALSDPGGGLGYGPDTPGNTPASPQIAKSVAVKFDLYDNHGEGPDSTGLFVNGDSPTVPTGANPVEATVDMTGMVDLHSGDVMSVTLLYDGTTLQETVTDTATKAAFTQSYRVDIPSIVGGNDAYVGFTAGTGGVTATQDILTWTYTPLPAPPATPTNFTVTPASGTELDLAWSETSAPVDQFTILRKGPTDTTFTQLAQVPGTQHMYANAGLTQNTTYSYEVIASNAGGDSTPAGPVTGTTPIAPAAPSNLQVTNITTTGATLTWTDNANNETGYRISRQLASNNPQLVILLPANTTTYTDTGLLPGSPYQYVVAAYNLAGPSSGADAAIQTVALAPAGVQASGGADQVTLTWAASTGATGYNVYRGTAAGAENATPVASGVVGTSFTDPGLTAGQHYYYEVTAVDGGGESAKSAEQSATAFLPGDADGDGKVDFTDLVALARNYGTATGATYAMGDFNGDGKVDFTDLVILARNYGSSVPATAPAAVSASAPLTPALNVSTNSIAAAGAVNAADSATSAQTFSQNRIATPHARRRGPINVSLANMLGSLS